MPALCMRKCKASRLMKNYRELKAMVGKPSLDVTLVLQDWANVSDEVRGQIVGIMYEELRRNAQNHLRSEHRMHELQPTLLVHEAYLRLVKANSVNISSRAHFLGIAGRIMRQVLVDEARRFSSGKRDRGLQTRFTGDHENGTPDTLDILILSELLDGLEAIDPLYVQIFEARAFGGLTFEECATTLEISVSSVKRKWKIALAWLMEQYEEPKSGDGPNDQADN